MFIFSQKAEKKTNFAVIHGNYSWTISLTTKCLSNVKVSQVYSNLLKNEDSEYNVLCSYDSKICYDKVIILRKISKLL